MGARRTHERDCVADVTLSPHQLNAIDWLIDELTSGAPLVALRGLAGTGKSTCIPFLRDVLDGNGLASSIGAPTHRAAMILRRKGITGADTVHSLALTPSFTKDYVAACRWLTPDDVPPCKHRDDDPSHDEVLDDRGRAIPWLIADRIQPDWTRAWQLRNYGANYRAQRRLQSLGISGKDFFDGFGPKAGEGVLLIDEGSMVGTEMLALCQQAYPQVCLIGDPGQLPPVKDTPILHEVPGFDLKEIHRQAADSPIIQLAYRARNGEPFWQEQPMTLSGTGGLGASVQNTMSAEASQFLESPLIVWRNVTRLSCTKGIRSALEYSPELLYVGEPLVCRSTDKDDRAIGFYNNGLYRVVEVDQSDPRHVVVEDALGEVQTIYAHLEELDGPEIPPRAIPFRFGYCLMAHTAQGGEWPTVYISQSDLVAYVKFCASTGYATEQAQWTYTAITRAKETLVFLTSHTFTTHQEGLPMPTMIATPPEDRPKTDAPIAPPYDDGTPDILDPPVPPEALEASSPPVAPIPLPALVLQHEALLQGFCTALQDRLSHWILDHHKNMERVLDVTYAACKSRLEAVAAQNDHASYQMSDALLKLHDGGLAVLSNPYEASIEAVSPQGYPVMLKIVKKDASELTQAVIGVTAWLQTAGYTVPQHVGAF